MPYVQLPDYKMHYVEQGAGDETLLFVHGYVSSHRWWQPTLERLPDNYHAYAVDLRACGQSEEVETGHTFEQYAEDLNHFAEALALPPFILVAHSMGGQVAIQVALEQPERLKALVLVDPVAASGNKNPLAVLEWCRAEYGNPVAMRAIIEGAFASPPASDYLEELVADGLRWGEPVYQETLQAMWDFNVAARLGEMTTPTLVTWGDKDGAVPFAGIAELFSSIPGCGLEVWHGVGHSGPIEIPERFVSLLDRFIAEVNAAPVEAMG